MCMIALNMDSRMLYPSVFLVYLSFSYISFVVIKGWGKYWDVMFAGTRDRRGCTKLFNFSVISNLSVKVFCVRIFMLCYCISLWMSCLYCNLMNAQLCNPWLSRGCPNKGESATNVLQSNRRGILLLQKCLYLSS